jgi:hypothetical protein
MIEQIESPDVTVLAFRMSGKLHDPDYDVFVPAVEQAIRDHGKVRLIGEFVDFEGWDMHAVWDDTKFAMKHYADIEKVALMGYKRWEKCMAAICIRFTAAEVKYFELGDKQAAWDWIVE